MVISGQVANEDSQSSAALFHSPDIQISNSPHSDGGVLEK